MKKILIAALLFFIPLASMAFQPLTVDQAFDLSAKPADDHTVFVQWKIAPGYHLYKDKISFKVVSPSDAQLGSVALPSGVAKQDDVRGQYQIYVGSGSASIPIAKRSAKTLVLAVNYQGCADSGFCYPPTTKQLTLNFSGNGSQTNTAAVAPTDSSTTAVAKTSAQDEISQLLANNNWGLILLGFFGFGLLLAFTPCVLPMIPILSGIIVGQSEEITALKAFWLALTYVLAMAVTYALAGILAGLAGNYVQAFLQSPWVIGTFSAIFVLLALSLFGFYELKIPNSWHHHMTNLSNKQTGGDYVGVAVMGCLSTLILSPCVTAPLIGALSYIGKTGNAVLGGSALFAMGVGMGIPLIIIGTVGGKFLPKAGVWMNAIKSVFGVIMLGVAILLLGRILQPEFTMMLWAGLLIISAVYMGVFTTTPLSSFGKLWKGCSLILLVYGFLLLIGAGMGNTDPMQPLALKQAIPVANIENAEPFRHIKGVQDLEATLQQAQGKPVLLDFSAEWCVSCKQMDRRTFKDPHVQSLLSKFVLLRADVTDNDAVDKELEKKLNVVAPPTVLFFDSKGNEIQSARIVGEMDAKDFLNHLHSVLGNLK